MWASPAADGRRLTFKTGCRVRSAPVCPGHGGSGLAPIAGAAPLCPSGLKRNVVSCYEISVITCFPSRRAAGFQLSLNEKHHGSVAMACGESESNAGKGVGVTILHREPVQICFSEGKSRFRVSGFLLMDQWRVLEGRLGTGQRLNSRVRRRRGPCHPAMNC